MAGLDVVRKNSLWSFPSGCPDYIYKAELCDCGDFAKYKGDFDQILQQIKGETLLHPVDLLIRGSLFPKKRNQGNWHLVTPSSHSIISYDGPGWRGRQFLTVDLPLSKSDRQNHTSSVLALGFIDRSFLTMVDRPQDIEKVLGHSVGQEKFIIVEGCGVKTVLEQEDSTVKQRLLEIHPDWQNQTIVFSRKPKAG